MSREQILQTFYGFSQNPFPLVLMTLSDDPSVAARLIELIETDCVWPANEHVTPKLQESVRSGHWPPDLSHAISFFVSCDGSDPKVIASALAGHVIKLC